MNSVEPHHRMSALEAWFFALVIFLSLVSLAAIALLSVSLFTPLAVLSVALVAFLFSVIFFRCCSSVQRLSRPEWGVFGLVLLAFLLRSNVGIVVYGGQDPGVYTNVSSYFAEHGSWIIKDKLLDEFEGRSDLREYYVTKSLRRVFQSSQGNWLGLMLPGVYLQDLDKNEWVSQFYHVNTVWLAIGEWIFGKEWKGLILALLSSLTLIAAYLITVRVCSAPSAGLAAVFLLATNAAHSYIGTSPVSEAVAGFFFLSAVAMLIYRWQFSAILPMTALFFTRITGFLTAPLILGSLAWIIVKRRDVRAVWAGLAVIGTYGLSVMWGLTFSRPYSSDIYRGKLGIAPTFLRDSSLFFVVLGVAWLVGCWLALRYQERLRPLRKYIVRYRTYVACGLLILVLGVIACRGYLLAFTDYYSANRWLGVRWHIAGLGAESLKFLTVYSLGLMLSPLGLVGFVIGLVYVGRAAIRRSVLGPVAICSVGFFAALTCKQLTTPYLYYFGRYLVSELLPLAIVCASVAIYVLTGRMHRYRSVTILLFCLCIFALGYQPLAARLKLREGHQFFEAMSCIDQATPGRSLLLIDKKDFPEVPVVTALRFSFDKPTFAVTERDFAEPGKLRDLISYFTSKGYTVHLLSSRDVWNSREGFNKVFRISAIMRKVSGKAEAPTKVRTLSHPIRLYSLTTPEILPKICEKVQGYS